MMGKKILFKGLQTTCCKQASKQASRQARKQARDRIRALLSSSVPSLLPDSLTTHTVPISPHHHFNGSNDPSPFVPPLQQVLEATSLSSDWLDSPATPPLINCSSILTKSLPPTNAMTHSFRSLARVEIIAGETSCPEPRKREGKFSLCLNASSCP
jgi:hypothetical protein